MNSKPAQDKRIGEFQTPLGKDELVLTRFDLTEGLGELFEYRIEALSNKKDINFDDALGQKCSLTYRSYTSERIFNGILVEAMWLGARGDFYAYQLVLRPWLWLLSRTSDCRMFLEKKAPEIIQQVFSDRGFSDFQLKLTESYPKLEYCVQYRETDFAFVSRLMEQHGIYYYFEHTKDKHMLVLADARSSHSPVPGLSSLPFLPDPDSDREDREHLYDWVEDRRFRTGKFELNDYDYMKPNASLIADGKSAARYTKSDMEIYDYPGKYTERSDGEKYAKVRMEAEQAIDQRRHGSGDSVNLLPGGLVQFERHPKGAENGEYLVVRASHSFEAESYRSGAERFSESIYHGNYQFLKSERPFRSALTTPKAMIHGPQTAKVVGKEGEEIDVDEMGRIKVEFFWDRKKMQSCRVRVAQVWSGKQWGGQIIPRIGMEVVVEHLEGDPDRPLVTGTVYNREYMYPYDMPGNKTQSGLKSNSSKGGNGFNEWRFEDKKGSEQIWMHGEKDHDVVIRHAETWNIGEIFSGKAASRDTVIQHGTDHLDVQDGNQIIHISDNQVENIDQNRTTVIGMNDTLTVGMNQTKTIGINQTETVGVMKTVTVGAVTTITSGAMIQLRVGSSTITMTPMSIAINSPVITINGSLTTTIQGSIALVQKGGFILLN